jgi:hypothetical protein
LTPDFETKVGELWTMTFYQIFLGYVLLLLNIWAIVDVAGSDKPRNKKVLWVLIIILVPAMGLLLYVFFGRGRFAVT